MGGDRGADGMIRATPIPGGSHLVRFITGDGFDYDRMTVATLTGTTIHLMGWLGKPLGGKQWMEARDALFPAATHVEFERIGKDGTLRAVRMPLPSKT